jgi:hypothetical protein
MLAAGFHPRLLNFNLPAIFLTHSGSMLLTMEVAMTIGTPNRSTPAPPTRQAVSSQVGSAPRVGRNLEGSGRLNAQYILNHSCKGGTMYQLRTATYLSIIIVLLGAGLVIAGNGLEVDRIAVGTAIEDREPVAAAETFSSDVGRVWCFSKITGAEAETTIVHVWYHEDVERARVELPVRSKAWRTWSAKQIVPQWTGQWRVVVEDGDGNTIGETRFTVTGS